MVYLKQQEVHSTIKKGGKNSALYFIMNFQVIRTTIPEVYYLRNFL
jgi:hypothetical protein